LLLCAFALIPMKRKPAIDDLLKVMARLRSPTGCPWDREQNHMTLRRHAIEEVYELIDAIEAGDDHEMAEELGDLLLQVVFHCQLAKERGAFDFDKVCRLIVEKLVRRHPHVFGKTKVKDVDEVWVNWEKIRIRRPSSSCSGNSAINKSSLADSFTFCASFSDSVRGSQQVWRNFNRASRMVIWLRDKPFSAIASRTFFSIVKRILSYKAACFGCSGTERMISVLGGNSSATSCLVRRNIKGARRRDNRERCSLSP